MVVAPVGRTLVSRDLGVKSSCSEFDVCFRLVMEVLSWFVILDAVLRSFNAAAASRRARSVLNDAVIEDNLGRERLGNLVGPCLAREVAASFASAFITDTLLGSEKYRLVGVKERASANLILVSQSWLDVPSRNPALVGTLC